MLWSKHTPLVTPTVLLLFIPMGDCFFCPSYAGFHPCRLQKQGMATACCELAYEGLGGVARNNGKQEKWLSRRVATYLSENEHVAWTISKKNIVFKPLFLQTWYIREFCWGEYALWFVGFSITLRVFHSQIAISPRFLWFVPRCPGKRSRSIKAHECLGFGSAYFQGMKSSKRSEPFSTEPWWWEGNDVHLEFSPRKLGKWFNLTSIFFQMGWFNHQLEKMLRGVFFESMSVDSCDVFFVGILCLFPNQYAQFFFVDYGIYYRDWTNSRSKAFLG